MPYLYKLNIVINKENEDLELENKIEEVIKEQFKMIDCVEIVGGQTIQLNEEERMVCLEALKIVI